MPSGNFEIAPPRCLAVAFFNQLVRASCSATPDGRPHAYKHGYSRNINGLRDGSTGT
jgi:hypothetical protein